MEFGLIYSIHTHLYWVGLHEPKIVGALHRAPKKQETSLLGVLDSLLDNNQLSWGENQHVAMEIL